MCQCWNKCATQPHQKKSFFEIMKKFLLISWFVWSSFHRSVVRIVNFRESQISIVKRITKKLFSHDKKHLTLQPPQIEIKKNIDGSQFHKLCTWGERFYRYFKTNRFYGWAIVGFLLSARVHNATPIPFCFTRFSSWD